MRVVFSGWFWNRPETGSGQYIRRLVDALARTDTGIRMNVLVPSGSLGKCAGVQAVSNGPLVSRPARATNLGKLWWEQVTVPTVARSLGCDLLHVPYWAPPACTTLPTVVTIHDIIPRVLPAYRGDLRVRLYTAFVSAATSRARLVLTDSQASREDIMRHLQVNPERVRTVPLAVGPEYTSRPSTDDAQIRASMCLPDLYLLYLGGFDIRKDLKTALSAFQIVQRSLPGVALVIGGKLPETDTPFTPDPRRIARDLGLPPGTVRFPGFVPEAHKPALYRGARAFVFPSTYEGFGYPLLEAISCGIPVVASSTSSLPEVVGRAGVLLDIGDIDGFAGALIQLLSDDAFHSEISQRTVEQAGSFSWTQTATQTLAAYHGVV
ncbi:MAG: glycosyltransferase family 4 protein [Anaerolineae bacterium]|nr:glycosyltransferase family 4 protein [Anaerolineae bacterium]